MSLRGRKKSDLRAAPAGVTSIEVLVATAIAVVALLVTAEVTIVHSTLYRSFGSATEINRAAVLPLERIRAAVMSAKRVVDNRTIGGAIFQSGKETIVLELPSVDASQNIIVGSSDFLAIARDQLNPTKIFTVGEIATSSARNGVKTQIASLVENFRFRYNDVMPALATKVDVTLTVSQTALPTKPRAVGGLTFILRNK